MMPLFLVITENKAFAQLCRKALQTQASKAQSSPQRAFATAEKASLPFLPTMFFSTVIVRTIWTTTS